MGYCVKVGLLFVICSCAVITDAANLPSSFGRCSVKDPKVDECFKKNIEDAIHQLKAGAPEIGLSSLDPLEIPELLIGENSGPVNFKQHFKNIKLHGLTDSKVLAAHADFDRRILTAKSITPEIRLEGKYSMDGKVLLLPIVGDGECNITLINTRINHTIYAEPVLKNGKKYWNFYNYTVTLRPKKMIFKFDNLFGGDEKLSNNILSFMNDNWKDVFSDVRDGYEKGFGLIFQELGNRVYSRVPLKDIYLDFE